MTYTNGYQSQNTGSSAYSPFNRTAGAQQPQYEGYPAAVPASNDPYNASAPGMATDSFVGPASHEDIDTLSGNIDNKIAQIRQAFSGGAPTAAPMAPAAPAVSDADIQWALQLEQKVKGGQTPTPEETARYENIAQRLSQPQAQPQQPGAPAAPAVSDADIQWALQLEQKVKGGQTPTPEETARYENIAQRLSQPQAQQPGAPAAPAAPAVSDADIQWALQLEQKVKGGQTATPEETARYENIAQRLSSQQQGAQQPQAPTQQTGAPRNWADWSKPFTVPAAPTMPLPITGPGGQAHLTVPTSLRGAPQTPPSAVLNQAPGTASAPMTAQNTTAPSQADIDWALQLEQRVNQQSYQPNAQETARYQAIAQALSAAQQQPQQAPGQQPVQPVAVPQQFPGQQQPQVAPQQAAPQAAANLPPGLNQQELNWALELEQRVQQGYQPNPQELAAYENIAQRLQQAQAAPPQQQYTGAPQQAAPGNLQQNGQQWVTPQGAPPTQLVPQNYPFVQQQTPQALVPPPPLPQVQNSYAPQPGMPQQPGMPAQFPPGQQPPQQPQAPGFLDKAKAAWSMLWS